jgi:pentatricopeptide repeat protein
MRVIDRAHAEGVAATASSLSEVMRSCIKLGHGDTALKLFDQMLEKGAAPDADQICKSVLDRFFNLVTDHLDVERIRADGLRFFGVVQAHGLAPSFAMQNRVIVAWKSKPPKRVSRYLLKMKSSGAQLSRLSYFAILLASERSNPELTLQICDEMQTLGFQPDRVAYNAVLGACCELGLQDEARLLFKQMADRTLEPDGKTYRVMIRSCASDNRFEEAVTLFETMRERYPKLDSYTYHHAIHACISLQRIEYAVELYKDLIRANVQPLESTCLYLSSACKMFGVSDPFSART